MRLCPRQISGNNCGEYVLIFALCQIAGIELSQNGLTFPKSLCIVFHLNGLFLEEYSHALDKKDAEVKTGEGEKR